MGPEVSSQHTLPSADIPIVVEARFLRLMRDSFTKFESVNGIEKPGQTLSKC